MMRRTSSEAFEKIHQNGLLGRMQLRVYRALYDHGPLTGTELNFVLKGSKEASPSYHKRLSELLRQGVAVEIGTRKCSVTGQTVTIWDVTSDLPCLPESKKPGKGTAAAVMSLNAKLVKALEAATDRLEAYCLSHAHTEYICPSCAVLRSGRAVLAEAVAK